MPPDRREFLRLAAGASAGSLILIACSDAVVQSLPAASGATAAQGGGATSTGGTASAPTDGTSATASPSIASLQSYLQQHASSIFAMPAAAALIPTIAWAGPLSGSSSVASSLPNGEIFPTSSPLINGPLRNEFTASLPGAPQIAGYPCLAVNRPYTCKGLARTTGSPTIVRFMTDAPVLELAGAVADGSPQGVVTTLIVNDQLVPPKVLSSGRLNGGGWDVGTIRIDFGSRMIRDVWVETNLYLAYLKIDQYDTLFPVDDQTEPQITVIGDSYLQRQSANFGGGAIALEIGARLGIRKVAIDGIGGTGYWNSGGNVGNLNDRLPADAVDGSAIYLIMAGLNDYGDYTNPPPQIAWPTASTFEQAVTGYLQNLRAALPDAVIVVTAPFCPVAPMSDSTNVANAATNSGGLGDFLYMAQLHKNAVRQLAPPWVYIDVLMGGGWLNSSGATGDVTNLQWFTGGTPAPGTTATHKPGNTEGGGGGGFGGIASIPVLGGGQYNQAPDIGASGGSGSGLLLASSIDSAGALTAINIVSPGSDYTGGIGLPTVSIDATYLVTPATLGTPVVMEGINPNGGYPLPSFAPPGVTGDLNNIYVMLLTDLTHPSPDGVEYLSTRLAQNIYQAVMAL